MSEPQHAPAAGVDGFAAAFARLSEETAALVRQEIESVRAELLGRARRLAPSAGLLAAGGLAGAFATASAYRLSVRLLEARLSPASAALVATMGYGAVAAGTLAAAIRQLREAPAPFPADTVRDTLQAAERVRDSSA